MTTKPAFDEVELIRMVPIARREQQMDDRVHHDSAEHEPT
jgi:hypothetical protein